MEQNSFYSFLHFPGSLQVTEFINRQGDKQSNLKKVSDFFGFNKL